MVPKYVSSGIRYQRLGRQNCQAGYFVKRYPDSRWNNAGSQHRVYVLIRNFWMIISDIF